MGDPLFRRTDWKAARVYWLSVNTPCARCKGAIDRRPGACGPWSLDVGHVVSRYEARRQGWTDGQINALSNTQSEHRRCNRAAGGRLGNHVKAAAAQPRPLPRVSRSW